MALQQTAASIEFFNSHSSSPCMQRYSACESRYSLSFAATEKTSESMSGAFLRVAYFSSPLGQLIETRSSGILKMEKNRLTNSGQIVSSCTPMIHAAAPARKVRHRWRKQLSMLLRTRRLLAALSSSAQDFPILSCHMELEKDYALVGCSHDGRLLLSVLR